jgi:hypothetical protein
MLVNCPVCETPIGQPANWNDDPSKAKLRPEPGSVSMCFHCFDLLIFNPDMTMRKLTPSEYNELSSTVLAEIGRLKRKIRAYRRSQN